MFLILAIIVEVENGALLRDIARKSWKSCGKIFRENVLEPCNIINFTVLRSLIAGFAYGM